MNRLILFLLLVGSYATAQDGVFCWNAAHGRLEAQGVSYVTNENLFNPGDTGNRPPVVSEITVTSTSTTVSGSINLQVTATDDSGIYRYNFKADNPWGDAPGISFSQYTRDSNTAHIGTYRFSVPGVYRTYVYVRDEHQQSVLVRGPIITVTE